MGRIVVRDRTIEAICVVDDDAGVRQALAFPIEELDLQPLLEAGPLPTLGDFVSATMERAQAVICDHHLRVRKYADYNGAELVAAFYQARCPALLCTNWAEEAGIDEVRRFRYSIPVLLRSDEVDPASISGGLEACVDEFRGVFSPSRRSWRTQVRVEDVGTGAAEAFVYVVVPGWSREVIRIYRQELPDQIRQQLNPGQRLHALVNIGAESHEELYFREWEAR